jgi:hypothetical protein
MGGLLPLDTSLFTPWYSHFSATAARETFIEAFTAYEYAIHGPEVFGLEK